jgi:hypothetical protein
VPMQSAHSFRESGIDSEPYHGDMPFRNQSRVMERDRARPTITKGVRN